MRRKSVMRAINSPNMMASSPSQTGSPTINPHIAADASSFLPQPSLLSPDAFFPNNKIHLLEVHPLKPWVLFADRSKQQVVLFDYDMQEILHSISLVSLFEQRREEVIYLKTLEKNYDNIEFPQWFLELDQSGNLSDYLVDSVDKILKHCGELIGVKLFDEDVVNWKLNYERERFPASMADLQSNNVIDFRQQVSVQTLQAINKRLGFNSSHSTASKVVAQSSQHSLPASASNFIPRRTPRCILLHFDHRIILLRYDDTQQIYLFVDEVKHTQLEKQSVTCVEFIYTHPLIALGCSDGCIRLWNYADKTVLPKKITAHSKSVLKMHSIHREDPLNNLPSLISSSSDGSLVCWNLDKLVCEFQVQKSGAQQDASIVDVAVDNDKNHIICLTTDKSVVIRNTRTGVEMKRFVGEKLIKGSMRSISLVRFANCIPNWLVLTTNESKIYLISADLNEKTFSDNMVDLNKLVVFDEKKSTGANKKNKVKFFVAQSHPLRPNILFLGSSVGLYCVKFDDPFYEDDRIPSCATTVVEKSSISTAAATTTVEPSTSTSSSTAKSPPQQSFLPSLSLPGMDLDISSPEPSTDNFVSPVASPPNIPQLDIHERGFERSLFYLEDMKIMQRKVTLNGSTETYSRGKAVFSLNRQGNVRMSTSSTGKYIALLWEYQKEFDIYRTDIWKLVATGNLTHALVWSLQSDRYAVLKGNLQNKKRHVSIFEIRNSSVLAIKEMIVDNALQIYGGYYLGIAMAAEQKDAQTKGFYFYDWNNAQIKNSSNSLPIPSAVEWDALTLNCLFLYEDAFAIFSFAPTFHLKCYIKENIWSAKWWYGTLFIATYTEIKCLFPSRQNVETVLLAAFDVSSYANFAHGNQEDCLDPMPQPRPRGSIALCNIVGDFFFLLDVNNNLYSLSLDHAALKFRLLVAAGRVKQALEWLPFIPEELHVHMCKFLCNFGYETDACQVVTLLPPKRFLLCLQYAKVEEGMQTLKVIERDRAFLGLLEDDQLAKLYLKLGAVSDSVNNVEIASKCYQRAAQLSLHSMNEVISFLAKHEKWEELKQMKENLQQQQQAEYIPLIDIFLQSEGLVGDLCNSNELSLAALANSKLLLRDQNELLVQWKESVGTNYPHMSDFLN